MANYQQHSKNQERVAALMKEARLLDEQNKRLEQTPEFKDARIQELERRVATLEKELEPHRQKAERKSFDERASLKCTNRSGCGCMDCNNL